MSGLSPKLPILRDSADGYALTQTYVEMVSQNLKNLLLTIPGERMMDPLFGVGLKKFLFEQQDISTYSVIHATTLQQVREYMPFIDILDIEFFGPNGGWSPNEGQFSSPDWNTDPNRLQMRIYFLITPLGQQSTLDLDLEV